MICCYKSFSKTGDVYTDRGMLNENCPSRRSQSHEDYITVLNPLQHQLVLRSKCNEQYVLYPLVLHVSTNDVILRVRSLSWTPNTAFNTLVG